MTAMSNPQTPSLDPVILSEPAEQDQVKLDLMRIIGQQLSFYKYRQFEAAQHLGISQAKISSLLNGKTALFSWAKLIGYINFLGWDVDIVIRRPRSANYRKTGVTTVIQA